MGKGKKMSPTFYHYLPQLLKNKYYNTTNIFNNLAIGTSNTYKTYTY